MKAIIFYVTGMAVSLLFLSPMYSCHKPDMDGKTFRPFSTIDAHQKALHEALPKVDKEGGWLVFESMDAFSSTMDRLHRQYDVQELGKWEAQLDGFHSLRQAYAAIDADQREDRRAPTVDSLIRSGKLLDCPDSHFATVLNSDGFIRIADTVYSFSQALEKGLAFAIPAVHADAIIGGKDPRELKGTQIHPMRHSLIPIPIWPDRRWTVEPVRRSICDFPSASMPNWWGRRGGDIYGGNNGQAFPLHNGRTVKLNYNRWRVGYIFYASTGVRLKLWKHTRFAGWQSITNAEEMVMEACVKGTLLEPIGNTPFQVSTSPAWPGYRRTGTNVFEKTLMYVTNGVIAEILLDHFNFHFRVNYRGRIVERTIRE